MRLLVVAEVESRGGGEWSGEWSGEWRGEWREVGGIVGDYR